MKRKREKDEGDELIEKIKNTSLSIKKQSNLKSTSRTKEKINKELEIHEEYILEVFVDAIQVNKMKIFLFICEDYPTLIPEGILFRVKNIENLEMLNYLFDKKFISKLVFGNDKDLLIHFISLNNIVVAEYLIKVQQFDLNFKSEKTGRTGLLIYDLIL
jgi:hypothetical protein